MAKYVVAEASEIPPGARKKVTVGGRPIVVFNLKGEYYALLDRCPHQGASLCAGHQTGFATSTGPGDYAMERAGEIIRCPWHGWEFDIKTGQSWFDPEHTKVRSFEAGVSLGSELVMGPYKAETFEVAVEEEYVVVQA
jgi:3-phenylpropionate/trans-cinnamate dioxygenase ferredoxin subunit